MKIEKKAGICMDHLSAHIMEYTTEPIEMKTIESKFTHEEKELSLTKGERHMHIKEQHQESEYYKKIGDAIRNYEEVVLFGPTDAKVELHNILKTDHLFSKIKIEIKNTDKMTASQQNDFVREYFSKH